MASDMVAVEARRIFTSKMGLSCALVCTEPIMLQRWPQIWLPWRRAGSSPRRWACPVHWSARSPSCSNDGLRYGCRGGAQDLHLEDGPVLCIGLHGAHHAPTMASDMVAVEARRIFTSKMGLS